MGCGASTSAANPAKEDAPFGDKQAAPSTQSSSGPGSVQAGGSCSSTAPAPDSASAEATQLELGCSVVISGIKAKPELNGQVAKVLKFDGGPDHRYTVKVANGTQVSLRASNLSAAPPGGFEKSSQDPRPTPLQEDESAAPVTVDLLSPKSARNEEDPMPPLYQEGQHVLVSGIEKRPELNGKVGQIVHFEGGADYRYTVSIIGTQVKLKENNLSATEAPLSPQSKASNAGCVAASVAAAAAMSSAEGVAVDEAHQPGEGFEDHIQQPPPPPMGELDGRGVLVPTYHWVEVPSVASLPLGMEVQMPLSGGKWARIPSTWRLQVVAEGQVDTYRCDVGEHTLLIEVVSGALAAFGWADMELRKDGKLLPVEDDTTVGSANLFGGKMSAVKLQ